MKRIFTTLLIMILCLNSTLSFAAGSEWKCEECKATNNGNFCGECGSPKPVWVCAECAAENVTKYCSNCGIPRDYSSGLHALNNGEYEKAVSIFERLSYGDSSIKLTQAYGLWGMEFYETENYTQACEKGKLAYDYFLQASAHDSSIRNEHNTLFIEICLFNGMSYFFLASEAKEKQEFSYAIEAYEAAVSLFEQVPAEDMEPYGGKTQLFYVCTTQIAACQTAIKEEAYDAALALKNAGRYEEAIAAFRALNGYRYSTLHIAACQTAIKDEAYDAALALKAAGKYEEAIAAFNALNGYRDSTAQIAACQTVIKEEAYDAALALKNAGKYKEAISAFEALNKYKDSADMVTECTYLRACSLKKTGDYAMATTLFEELGSYKDSKAQLQESTYKYALRSMRSGEYEHAIAMFESLNGYNDSVAHITECKYLFAKSLIDQGFYNKARNLLTLIESYKDSSTYIELIDDVACVILSGTSEYNTYSPTYLWVTHVIDTETCTKKYICYSAGVWGSTTSTKVRTVWQGTHRQEWKQEGSKITMTNGGEKPGSSLSSYDIWTVANNWSSVYEATYYYTGERSDKMYDINYKKVDTKTAKLITESYISCYEEEYGVTTEDKYFNIFVSVFFENGQK